MNARGRHSSEIHNTAKSQQSKGFYPSLHAKLHAVQNSINLGTTNQRLVSFGCAYTQPHDADNNPKTEIEVSVLQVCSRDSSHNKLCAWKSVTARRQHQQTRTIIDTGVANSRFQDWHPHLCQFLTLWAHVGDRNPPHKINLLKNNRRTPNEGDTIWRMKHLLIMQENRGMLKTIDHHQP